MQTRRASLFLTLSLLTGTCAAPAHAAPDHTPQDRWFTTSDGVRLHYIEAGRGPTLVFVPGWSMPAWIWQGQIDYFSRRYRVIAFDPRSQGESEIAPGGYEPFRRGQDIAELIAALGPQPVLLVGWSLGVLDSLAYVHEAGDAHLAGLVLVDNSVGEEPAPIPAHHPRGRRGPKPPRDVWMHSFVRSMFRYPPDEAWLDQLTESALRMPPAAAARLLAYPVPRSFWRDALYTVRRPVLYVIRPKWSAQAANVALHDPYAETVTFTDAGHALFIDQAARFNAVLQDFITRRVFR